MYSDGRTICMGGEFLPTRHDGWKESCANGVLPRHWA
jgi:hypothetical protein